jgi:hypothetical protein
MMVAHHALSRRALLKASSFLAATVVAVPALATQGHSIPEVLTVLLTEYEAAARAAHSNQEALYEAKHAFDRALSKDRLYLPWECGTGQVSWLGHVYSGSVDPWTAGHRLTNARDAALAACAPKQLADVRRRFRNKQRQLRRQLQKYASVKASFGIPALEEKNDELYFRFSDVQKALRAYRPSTIDEVREIARVLRHTPTSHGSGFEWMFAGMLEIEGEA